MLVCKGGKKAGRGTYWDMRNGCRIDVDRETVLPGGDASVYLRIPSGVLLLFVPVMGLLYVILFPFIGLFVVLSAVGRKAGAGIAGLIAKNLSFHWVPRNAHLTGKRKEKTKKGERAPK